MSTSITTKKPIHAGKKTLSPQERGSPDERHEQYVESFAALADKYLQYIISGHKIPFGIVLIAVGVIFIYETRGDELQSWENLFWVMLKTLFPVVL